jgi:hypothetical protein
MLIPPLFEKMQKERQFHHPSENLHINAHILIFGHGRR